METADARQMVEPGKLFVGGLSWDTTEVSFKNHFEQYGEVESVKIMKDVATEKPRGFGFVTFKDPSCALRVLSEKEHHLDGKKIDPKPATNNKEAQTQNASCKVFVGGLPINCKENDIITACSAFGKVTAIDIKYKGDKPRGFAFVDFKDKEMAEACVLKHYISVNSKQVEIKEAQPRYKLPPIQGHGQSQQQQSIPPAYAPNYSFYGMGRGLSGAAATPFYSTSHYQYSPYPGQYPAQYDFRNPQFTGQQVALSSYADTTPVAYSQQRNSFGTGTSEQYNGGATNYSGYEHLGYSSFSPDQTGSISYNDHNAAATAQQRSGYTYGRS